MKVLVLQLRQLGDVLLSSVLCKALKEAVREAEVHFLTSPAGGEVLRANPFVDRVITLERGLLKELRAVLLVRGSGFDALIDPQRTASTKRLSLLSGIPVRVAFYKRWDNFCYTVLVEHESTGYTAWDRLKLLSGLGVSPKSPYYPEFFLKEEEVDEGRRLLREMNLKEGKFFVVVPTARRPQKAWEPEKFGALSEMISRETGLTPLICYAPGERSTALRAHSKCPSARVLGSPVPIRIFGALLFHSAFALGNDSFASHLSFAVGKHTLVVLGPYDSWFPEHPAVFKLRKGLECQPCGEWKNCSRNFECYRGFTPEEAYRQAESWMSQILL